MSRAEARWQAMQAEALVGALVHTLERSLRAVEGAEAQPVLRDVAALALADARLLQKRVSALRKRTEQPT